MTTGRINQVTIFDGLAADPEARRCLALMKGSE